MIVDDGGPSLRLTIDLNSPFPITNLYSTSGTTWINFTWANPSDPDFKHTEVYLNGTFITNIPTPINYYNATGLLPDTSYQFSTRTVDTSGNINQTWVNHTARTLPDTAPHILKGDVNGDGILSSVDALMALQMAAGNIAQNLAADVNEDGIVTSLDALMILQASVGAIVL